MLPGCSQEKTKAAQIAPMDKGKINIASVQINKELRHLSDQELIDDVLKHLDKIKFKRVDARQEKEFFNDRKILSLDSLITIQLKENEWSMQQADILVISESELLLADSETMRNSRTVLYINQTDESSLESVREIYLAMKKGFNEEGLPSVATSEQEAPHVV